MQKLHTAQQPRTLQNSAERLFWTLQPDTMAQETQRDPRTSDLTAERAMDPR